MKFLEALIYIGQLTIGIASTLLVIAFLVLLLIEAIDFLIVDPINRSRAASIEDLTESEED